MQSTKFQLFKKKSCPRAEDRAIFENLRPRARPRTWPSRPRTSKCVLDYQWRAVRLLVGEAQFFLTYMSMPELERSFKGANFFLVGPKFLGWSSFHQVLCCFPKKKVIAPLWSTFLRGIGWFPKKNPPSWNCCKDNESLGGYAGQFFFGGGLFRGCRPLLPPPS